MYKLYNIYIPEPMPYCSTRTLQAAQHRREEERKGLRKERREKRKQNKTKGSQQSYKEQTDKIL